MRPRAFFHSPAIVICWGKGLEETPRSEPPTSATQTASTITALPPMRHSVTRHADMHSLTYGRCLFVGFAHRFSSFLSRLSLARNATTAILGAEAAQQVDYIWVVVLSYQNYYNWFIEKHGLSI